MAKIEAPAGTQAVLRAIGLLKAFGANRSGMSLQTLAERVKLTKTTAYRLLSALESEGLVVRQANGNNYQLGPAVIELGSKALLTSDLRNEVRPWLEALAARSGETSTLEVLAGDRILILDGIAGRHLVSATLDVGTSWPLHTCSTGKAMLSALPPSQWAGLVREPLIRLTPNTVTDLATLQRQVGDVRRRCYALAVEEIELDYVAVAAEFYGPLGNLLGALSVGGPASRFRGSKIAELGNLVRQLANHLSTRHETGAVAPPAVAK